MPKFYAVAIGRDTGVFYNWPDCQTSVIGYSGAVYKFFRTEQEVTTFYEKYINKEQEEIEKQK